MSDEEKIVESLDKSDKLRDILGTYSVSDEDVASLILPAMLSIEKILKDKLKEVMEL